MTIPGYDGHKPIWAEEQQAIDAQVRAAFRRGPKTSALVRQEGGEHYKDMAIQPVEFIHRNGIGYLEGCCIKYLCRWRKRGGLEDLKKARHFIDLLIEMETEK